MLTKESVEELLRKHDMVVPRLDTLRVAEELDPAFQSPHIFGGYLRNFVLNAPPNDCDVVFKGYMRNQPGIMEAVREAEVRLGIAPYPEWEFENVTATGPSGDFYSDTLGMTTYHTDFFTMLMMDTSGKLFVGRDQTLTDLEHRIYDLYFPGVAVWANHRGAGRSFPSCLVGDLMRGLYLCQSLEATPSKRAALLMGQFDKIFGGLQRKDQEARREYWQKKTHQSQFYQPILDRFGIKELRTG